MQVKFAPLKAKGALGARCDYLGSPTNLVRISECLTYLWSPLLLAMSVVDMLLSVTTLLKIFLSLLLLPQVMVSSIAAMFVAGRFGLAPSSNRVASAGLNLSARETGQDTRDPAGFTGADVLAFGATGHILGAGIVLALKYLGAI